MSNVKCSLSMEIYLFLALFVCVLKSFPLEFTIIQKNLISSSSAWNYIIATPL